MKKVDWRFCSAGRKWSQNHSFSLISNKFLGRELVGYWGLAGWAGWAGWAGRGRRLFAHVLGNIDMLVLGSVRGRRLFAHVLGNIDILVPRGASQEAECVPKPVFL